MQILQNNSFYSENIQQLCYWRLKPISILHVDKASKQEKIESKINYRYQYPIEEMTFEMNPKLKALQFHFDSIMYV